MLRQGKAWGIAVISTVIWCWGFWQGIEWMQWQILFFLPAIAGYYLDALFDAYHRLSATVRKAIRFGSIGLTAATIAIAAVIILPHEPGTYQETLFGRDPVTLATIAISFVWFLGLLSFFQLILPWLTRWFGWLLLTFGERSLTAYILHTIPLVICQVLFAESNDYWLNTILTGACIIATWGLLKIPRINRIIPR